MGVTFITIALVIGLIVGTVLLFPTTTEKYIGRTALDRFFIECVLSGCNDFSIEKNVEKCKLLASKYSLVYPDGIETLYKKALKEHEEISAKIESDNLIKLSQIEHKEYTELNRYASYYGRDKKIAMLTDKMNELNKQASSLDTGAKEFMRSIQQKESDWAIWGGLADGIAGPAAGVTTALDIQAKNTKIRAQNEANIRAAMPLYMSATKNSSQYRNNAAKIKSEIELVKEKLMYNDISSDNIMRKLKIINPTVEVSKTGAFKVTATVQTMERLYIFGDVPAVVDGTIIAHVFEDGKEIGTANMVIPVNGIVHNTGIIGMSLTGAHQEKKQTVTFSAGNLWIMEQ